MLNKKEAEKIITGTPAERGIFPVRLEQLILNNDVKFYELAQAIGVKPSTISGYVNARVSPNAEKIYQISQYFNVSADYLLGMSDAPRPGTQNAADVTGLSIEAINEIIELKELSDSEKAYIKVFSDLVEYFGADRITQVLINMLRVYKFDNYAGNITGPIAEDLKSYVYPLLLEWEAESTAQKCKEEIREFLTVFCNAHIDRYTED